MGKNQVTLCCRLYLSKHLWKVVDVGRSVCLCLEPFQLKVVLCDVGGAQQ